MTGSVVPALLFAALRASVSADDVPGPPKLVWT
jgi:hypothetical protein